MPAHNSTGKPPAFLQSKPTIRPAIIRGQLCFAVGDVAFAEFRLAACAWSAAEAHRLDIAEPLDALIVRRAVALTEMATAGSDLLRFRSASKREATLAAEIRRIRREGGVR